MFPLRDNVPSRTVPFVNFLIIFANVAVFLHEWRLMGEGLLEGFIRDYGLVPSRFFADPIQQVTTIFSSMFLHGSWGHLIGNMWFLFIFGDNVEDRVGHIKYFFYYLLMGVGAAAVQMASAPASQLPMVGASGAIAGVLGSYFILFPHARVETFFILFVFIRVVEVPAFFFLGLWFVTQALNGVGSISTNLVKGESGGVAWWAHAGGFLTGFLAIHFFARRRR